jgi:hypothetical protein
MSRRSYLFAPPPKSVVIKPEPAKPVEERVQKPVFATTRKAVYAMDLLNPSHPYHQAFKERMPAKQKLSKNAAAMFLQRNPQFQTLGS